jgi:hypothetical protein
VLVIGAQLLLSRAIASTGRRVSTKVLPSARHRLRIGYL